MGVLIPVLNLRHMYTEHIYVCVYLCHLIYDLHCESLDALLLSTITCDPTHHTMPNPSLNAPTKRREVFAVGAPNARGEVLLEHLKDLVQGGGSRLLFEGL